MSLSGTGVDDAGLEHLRGLTKLRILGLGDTKVTGAGLESLKGMTGLENLNSHAVGDDRHRSHAPSGTIQPQILEPSVDTGDYAGLAHLKGLPSLMFLWLEDTKVTDAGLAHLKELPSLTTLWLGGKTTDAGLAGLTTLWLEDMRGAVKSTSKGVPCEITDAGLAPFGGTHQPSMAPA